MPRLDQDWAKIQRGTLESREENEILASASKLSHSVKTLAPYYDYSTIIERKLFIDGYCMFCTVLWYCSTFCIALFSHCCANY